MSFSRTSYFNTNLLITVNSLSTYQTFDLFLKSSDEIALNKYSKINNQLFELKKK